MLLLFIPVIAAWVIGWIWYAHAKRSVSDPTEAARQVQRAAGIYVPLLLVGFVPLFIRQLPPGTTMNQLFDLSKPTTQIGGGIILGILMVTLTIGFVVVVQRWSNHAVVVPLPQRMKFLKYLDNIGLILVAPLLEEFIFRGYGAAVFSQHSTIVAALITSTAFALWHANPIMIPVAFAIGMIFFYAYIWSGTLIVPIVGHVMGNAALAIYVRHSARRERERNKTL